MANTSPAKFKRFAAYSSRKLDSRHSNLRNSACCYLQNTGIFVAAESDSRRKAFVGKCAHAILKQRHGNHFQHRRTTAGGTYAGGRDATGAFAQADCTYTKSG